MFMIYGKYLPTMKRFKAMNWGKGYCVGNLIYASIFPDSQKEALEKHVDAARKDNPDWQFKLVHR
jgi:hypothetical protein